MKFKFTYMEKIRCINTKTGKIKFLTPLVAQDTAMLHAYNLIVQHLPAKKEDPIIETEVFSQEEEVLDLLSIGSEATTEAKPEPKVKTKTKK